MGAAHSMPPTLSSLIKAYVLSVLVYHALDVKLLCTQRMIERPDILGQQFGFFQRSEMAAAWHLSPALNS